MKNNGALSASLEDYLEAIFKIIKANGSARSKDIAKSLGVTGPSVTGALRQLSSKGLVNYTPYDRITLTLQGREFAEKIARMHNALRDFFKDVLLIDDDTAEATACKLEHVVPSSVLNRMSQFVEFVKNCPQCKKTWIDGSEFKCDQEMRSDTMLVNFQQSAHNMNDADKSN